MSHSGVTHTSEPFVGQQFLVNDDLEWLTEAWSVPEITRVIVGERKKIFMSYVAKRMIEAKKVNSDFLEVIYVGELKANFAKTKRLPKRHHLAENPVVATSSQVRSPYAVTLNLLKIDNFETGQHFPHNQRGSFVKRFADIHGKDLKDMSYSVGPLYIAASTYKGEQPSLEKMKRIWHSKFLPETCIEVPPLSEQGPGDSKSTLDMCCVKAPSDETSSKSVPDPPLGFLSAAPFDIPPDVVKSEQHQMIFFRLCPCGKCWLVTYYGPVQFEVEELVRYYPDEFYGNFLPPNLVKCPCYDSSSSSSSSNQMVRAEADVTDSVEVTNCVRAEVPDAKKGRNTFTATEGETVEDE